MTNHEINKAVAECIWKPKDKGWFRKLSYGYEWHHKLPVLNYCEDRQLALELLETCKDYTVKKLNGTYYHVTLYVPSREFIGEGMTLAMAVAKAFIKLHEKEKV